jgi:hypothetical protein
MQGSGSSPGRELTPNRLMQSAGRLLGTPYSFTVVSYRTPSGTGTGTTIVTP